MQMKYCHHLKICFKFTLLHILHVCIGISKKVEVTPFRLFLECHSGKKEVYLGVGYLLQTISAVHFRCSFSLFNWSQKYVLQFAELCHFHNISWSSCDKKTVMRPEVLQLNVPHSYLCNAQKTTKYADLSTSYAFTFKYTFTFKFIFSPLDTSLYNKEN